MPMPADAPAPRPPDPSPETEAGAVLAPGLAFAFGRLSLLLVVATLLLLLLLLLVVVVVVVVMVVVVDMLEDDDDDDVGVAVDEGINDDNNGEAWSRPNICPPPLRCSPMMLNDSLFEPVSAVPRKPSELTGPVRRLNQHGASYVKLI
jgi:hypothetical protein